MSVACGDSQPVLSGKLYGWGLAKSQALPVHPSAVDLSSECIFPAPLILACDKDTQFVQVSADMGLFAALDTQHRMWAWGIERSIFPQIPTPCLNNVRDCAVGERFAIACTLGGEVLVVGRSPTGQETAAPQRVEAPAGVTRVAACAATALLLCEDGAVWGAGSDLTSGCGRATATWKKLELPPCAHIALGSRNGAAVTRDGGLWVWGDGLSGSLGLGKRIDRAPTPLEVESFRATGLRVVSAACTRAQIGPKRGGGRPFPAGQEGPRVHAVTEDGGLWIAGTTHKGLGGDHLGKTMQPARDHLEFYRVGGPAADAPAGAAVPTGAAEALHRSAAPDAAPAATSTTAAPAAGAHSSGSAPGSAPAAAAAAAAAAARRMGMADAADYGRGGATGYLTAARVVGTAAAHIHSLAVSADGRLFAWGCGSNGRLGLRAYIGGPGGAKRWMKCYVSTPSAVEALDGRAVVAAAAGRYWTIAIVRD